MTDFEKCSQGHSEIEYPVERTEGKYERNRMNLSSNVCKCVLARTFLLGISLVEWETLIWKKIEREKDAGVLVGNGVDFKSMIQWGWNLCDLRTH